MLNPSAQYTLPPWIDNLSIEQAVKLLLFQFAGSTAPSGGEGITTTTSVQGVANLATAQVTSTGTAAQLVAARPTRRSVLITNLEDPATDPDKIAYVGPATVTTGNGYPITPGQSVPFTWVGLIQVIDDTTNHAALAIADEYD